MNGVERAERNHRVVMLRLQGWTTKSIAKSVGLEERQVRRIVARWREKNPELSDEQEALSDARFLLASYDQTMSDLAALALTAHSPRVQLDALLAKLHVWRQKIELMDLLGMLPRRRLKPAAHAKLGDLTAELSRVCRRHQVPDTAVSDLVRAVSLWLRRYDRLEPSS